MGGVHAAPRTMESMHCLAADAARLLHEQARIHAPPRPDTTCSEISAAANIALHHSCFQNMTLSQATSYVMKIFC